MFNAIIFYVALALTLLFGILMLTCRNIFYSLISAVIVFFLAGIFFYILGSEYNAVIQLAVYGFAIPVILGLSIMFTNQKNKKEDKNKESNSKYIVFLTGGLFILALIYLIMISIIVVPDGFEINTTSVGISSAVNNLAIFSKGIFVRYVLGFEFVSLLLTIIVAGMVLINKRGGVK